MENVSALSLLTVETPTSMLDYWDDSSERVKSAFDIFFMIIYSAIFFLGFTDNGLVIWVAGFYMSCTVNTMWYLNRPVADFIIILSVPFQLVMRALH
ncbi:Formyl peptide receptor-related sequence 1 [Plecturocebus cupreus]